MDIVFSVLALAALLPIFLLAAFAISLESGWPVLFKQTRVGMQAREFGMYKFRSMVNGAQTAGPYFTNVNDTRITRVGRIIRRCSIDELPQLFNVLTGEMSLVGPRPDLPVQRPLYSQAAWAERCSVRPGITGLAQAILRSEGTERQRQALDLQYVRESSVSLDLKIMWLTVGRLSGKGGN